MPRLLLSSLAVVALLASGFGVLAQDAGQTQISPVMQGPLEKSRQAITECREKRLRGKISTYADSARCSNPQIFEAWKAANYPHMDLITEWLNAREAASEKVDQRIITPEEFEGQMDELTVRLTAEEQRRRAGQLSSADNTLQLSLPPPPPQTVGAPAGPPRSAAKRNAVAAPASAASQYDDAAQDKAVGSVGALSRLDPPKQPARAGAAFVPAPPSIPVTRAAAVSQGGNNIYALLSSQQKEVDARAIYRMLQEKYPEILGNRSPVIHRGDKSGQGASYRVEVGPLNSSQADQLCGTLRQAGAQCTQHYE